MQIHPHLFKLLRMVQLESPDYPGRNLLWCEQDASGLMLIAGAEDGPVLTAIPADKLRIKNAWGTGSSMSFEQIYLLFQQVHPGTRSIMSAFVPPTMSAEEAAAVQLQQREIKSEQEIWNGRPGASIFKEETRSGRIYLDKSNIQEVEPDGD